MYKLAMKTGYHDPDCALMFREGCVLLGPLPCTGNGTKVNPEQSQNITNLRENRVCANNVLVASLKEDEHSEALFRMASEDADLCRMTKPRPLKSADLCDFTLSPRFCIEQGVKRDGSPKLRAIDDLSRSGVNACTYPAEKLKCDTLDILFKTLKETSKYVQVGNSVVVPVSERLSCINSFIRVTTTSGRRTSQALTGLFQSKRRIENMQPWCS